MRRGAWFLPSFSSARLICMACPFRRKVRTVRGMVAKSSAASVRNDFSTAGTSGGLGKKNTATGHLNFTAICSSCEYEGAALPASQASIFLNVRLASSMEKPARSRAHWTSAGVIGKASFISTVSLSHLLSKSRKLASALIDRSRRVTAVHAPHSYFLLPATAGAASSRPSK